jgi:hypothetical protein
MLMDRDVLLVRYETLAANRRHFEALFFAVVAFSWCFSLALWAAITGLKVPASGMALPAAGAILSGGALIAYRLLRRERSCFDAMASSWRAISGEAPVEPKSSPWPGAMAIAAAGQGLAGLALMAVAAIGP